MPTGRPLHVLMASPAYKPAYRYGGPAVSVSRLAEMLTARGVRVTVFTTDSNLDESLDVPVDRPVDVDGVEVWYFRRTDTLQKSLTFLPYLSRSVGFLYAPAMRSALAAVVPTVDVVHTQGAFVYPTLAAARAAFRSRVPLCYHQRGAYNPDSLRFRSVKKRLYIAAVERPIMRRAARLVALTEFEARSFRALGLETPIRLIPNGVDARPVQGGSAVRAENRWGIPANAHLIMFLGRLHPNKGADRLLEAFARILPADPEARLVLAGPDEWSRGDELRAWVARMPAGRVIVTDMLAPSDKADLLARADLFCLPSRGEGFSLAILEALASGTPAVISPECHFDEVEAEGVGRVVSSDPAALAAVLAELLADPERRRAMGARGRALVESQYTWDHVADETLAMYDEIRRGRA